MANRGLFTATVLLMGLGLLFAGGINTTTDQAREQTTVTNESITVNYSDAVLVEQRPESVEYGDSVTVYNASGAELVAGTDYAWDASNGAVEWFNTNATTDGETAAITYSYTAFPGPTLAMNSTVKVLGAVLGLVVFLLIGQWLFEVVGDW